MTSRTLTSTLGRAAGLFAAASLTATTAFAQFSQVLFTDNFLTAISAPGDTTDLNTNIGSAGGRQGGYLVNTVNPAGFGWSVSGKASFTTGNGWDLRSQTNWPPSGAVDPYTLRFRDNEAGQWSTVTPNIGFSSFIVDNSYRIQTQIVHAHLDLNDPVKNDRWAAISFGAQPATRFPAFAGNAGVLIYPSGSVAVFSDGNLINTAPISVTVPGNGVFEVDLRIINGLGSLFVNNSLVASSLDFSGITPAWIGLTARAGTEAAVFSSTQIRFDNFAVSTVPEPSAAAALAGAVALGLVGARRRRARS